MRVAAVQFNWSKGNGHHYTVPHREKNPNAEQSGSIVKHFFTSLRRYQICISARTQTSPIAPCSKYFVIFLFLCGKSQINPWPVPTTFVPLDYELAMPPIDSLHPEELNKPLIIKWNFPREKNFYTGKILSFCHLTPCVRFKSDTFRKKSGARF
jgi:hypothetical protein